MNYFNNLPDELAQLIISKITPTWNGSGMLVIIEKSD
jgi:hypothetical protein